MSWLRRTQRRRVGGGLLRVHILSASQRQLWLKACLAAVLA